ncbi:hypothetical protein AXF42_Ash006717 [Apostasia shenzhenica]|uniref:Uncharacterized protein n=1 Tax=Apostasia shenzhenica TaxID=1088818 RepID=A0A2I0AJ16_9ASPA|nr:hypothetical protein AXF42_Ash006717 [Apostasia shenzhenica]
MGWILALARLWGIVVAVLVLAWALTFKSSFLPHSAATAAGAGDGDLVGGAVSQLDHIYSVNTFNRHLPVSSQNAPVLILIFFLLLFCHRRFTRFSWSSASSSSAAKRSWRTGGCRGGRGELGSRCTSRSKRRRSDLGCSGFGRSSGVKKE